MNICICGGGNLGHVCSGWLAMQSDFHVRVLTRHPERWSREICLTLPNREKVKSLLSCVTSDTEEALKDAEILLLCLPGFAIEEELKRISPYITSKMYVGSIVSSTGFFLMAKKILPSQTKLFGFQRVPFIARIEEYRHSASLLGYKSSLSLATLHVKDSAYICRLMEQMFKVPVKILGNYWEATLSNSNPILHPCRLYSLFGGGQTKNAVYDYRPFFYEDWDDNSSELLLACDMEFQQLLHVLGIPQAIPSLLEYYECENAHALTRKIRSIDAFKGLKAPMIETREGKFVPDYGNRYFVEDIWYGLRFIYELMKKHRMKSPNIDKVYEWGMSVLPK